MSVLASAGTTSETFTFNPTTGSGTQYQAELLDFTAMGPSTAITLTGSTVGGQFIGLDNFAVISADAVPEASTTVSFGLLLVLGFGGAIVAARKKKAAAAARSEEIPLTSRRNPVDNVKAAGNHASSLYL